MRMLRTARLAGAVVSAAVLVPAASAAGAVHTVAPGETLSGIAAVNRIPLGTLAAANGLSVSTHVIAGARLVVPGVAIAAPAAPALGAAPVGTVGGPLRVALGDTLSGIAARTGVSIARLAAANGLAPDAHVIAGARLTIPGGAGAGTSASAAPAQSGTAAAAGGGALQVRF